MKHSFLLLVLALGCGGSPAAPRAAEPAGSGSAPPPLELTFQTVAEDGAATRGVAIGSTLHTGDRIALEMKLNRPAYVYIVQFFADGSAGVLYPLEGEERPISGAQRIPGTGWFELDSAVGDENVYVIASLARLAEADAAIHRVFTHVRTSGKAPSDPEPADRSEPPPVADAGTPLSSPPPDAGAPPPPPPDAAPAAAATHHAQRPRNHGVGAPPRPPPPGGANMKSRGLTRVGASPEIHVTADAFGVAVFRFWFEHAAR